VLHFFKCTFQGWVTIQNWRTGFLSHRNWKKKFKLKLHKVPNLRELSTFKTTVIILFIVMFRINVVTLLFKTTLVAFMNFFEFHSNSSFQFSIFELQFYIIFASSNHIQCKFGIWMCKQINAIYMVEDFRHIEQRYQIFAIVSIGFYQRKTMQKKIIYHMQ